jgi:hypothetical protein
MATASRASLWKSAWGQGVQDDIGGLPRKLHQFGGRADCPQVENSGATGNENKIGGAGCGHSCTFRMRGGVYDG